MAAVSCVLSEDQFLCSICLEVFTDPVTTPCGHSFCKTCINKHWDNSLKYHCPVCKESFSLRPQLKLNTCLSEMVGQFKNESQDKARLVSELQAAEAEVLCDVCSEPKLKALKSCLVCLLSYCQSHLEPHITVPRLKKHQLIPPVENLEDRICSKHDRPLELFCRDDGQFICLQCHCADHRSHKAVPLKEECEVKQAEMSNIIDMIKERREKVEEIQRSVKLSQKNADREMEEGVEVFSDLMKCIEQSLEQFKLSIEDTQKKTEEEAAEWIQKIAIEICSLEQRRAEMEQLSSSEDHLHFLQTFSSVKPVPLQDWTQVTVKVSSYKGTVDKAMTQLHSLLQPKIKAFGNELKRVQQYAIYVTLDPDTAYPKLVLSEDLKQVHDTDQKQKLPDNPERFSYWLFVLGKQKLFSGKLYFEVQVKEKTVWFLGMAKESVDRKGKNGIKIHDGYWLLYRSVNNQYQTSDSPPVRVQLKSSPEKVGVFVDYEEGLVSFYDVDSAELIYSFTNCKFDETILPVFCPGNNNNGTNSAPLILTPIAK